MSNLSKEEYPLLETKEMANRKKELEKLNKENIIQKLVGTEETLKFYIDLYNKEKEKNIIFKRSTIITDIKRHGIEINMSADRLVNEYLLEKIKNSELEELLENSISKDKIIDLLDKYKNEHFIPKAEIQKLLEETNE